MKKLLLFIILILAIAAAVPVGGGYYFKRNYMQLISNINNTPQWPQIKVTSYKMGWLSSHVTLEIAPPKGEPDARLGNLDFSILSIDQTIKHGPLIFNGSTLKLALADIVSNIHLPAPVEQILIGNNPNGIAQVNSLVSFNGKSTDNITAPAFTVKENGLGELVFNGFNGDFSTKVTDNQMQMISGILKIGEINVTSDKAATSNQYVVNIKPITVENKANLEAIGLWSGKGNLNMPSMSIAVDSNTLVSILNLDVATSMQLNGDNLYSVSETVALDMVKIPHAMIPELGPALFKLEVNNINAKALLEFMNYTNSLNEQYENGIQLSPEQQNKLTQTAIQLIDPATEIVLQISGNTSDGEFKSDFVTSWKNGAAKPSDVPSLIMNTVITYNGRIAAPLLKMIVEKQVDELNKAQNMLGSKLVQGIQQQPNQTVVGDSNTRPDMISSPPQEASVTASENQSMPGYGSNTNQTTVEQPMDANSMINSWIAHGYIKQEGNDYVINITYKDGMILVNGKPMQALN